MTKTYLVDGSATLDRVEAASWDEAEALAAKAGGTVAGELVTESKALASHQFGEIKFADDGAAAMTFTGYGAVFNNVDEGGDMIAPGAFRKSLAEFKRRKMLPPMLMQHDQRKLPIGVWDALVEDETGLKADGRLLDTSTGLDVYKAMKAGAISGLSIGYRPRVVAMGRTASEPFRTIKELDLVEISVVTMPMNDLARVSGVKAEGFRSIREFESFLRDEGGFSAADAKRVASHGFKSLDAGRDASEGLGSTLLAADRLLQTLKG
jgi:HK97 family phage prohead protease